MHATDRRPAVSGLVFFVAEVAMFGLSRAPSWDEAVYLSQVTRGIPAASFVASRARGIVLLVAPVTAFTTSVWPVRLFLAAASAAAITFAFALWRDLIGARAALVAMWLFMGTWVTAFYGSAISPNLWMAVVGLATTAAMLHALRSVPATRKQLIELGALGLAAALMRPFDAAILAACLAAFAAIRYRTRAWRALGCLLGSTSAGLLAWLIEMSIRYSGPGAALRAARTYGHVGHGIGLLGSLRLADGPVIGPDPDPAFPVFGVLAVIALVALVILGLRARRRTRASEPAWLASGAGAVMLAAYLFGVGGSAPRFLLPGTALLCVPAGIGGVRIIRRGRPVIAVIAVLATAWIGYQVWIGRTVAADQSRQAAAAAAVGEHIRALDAGRPCVVLAWTATPQIAFAARCVGVTVGGPAGPGVRAVVRTAAAENGTVFLVGSSTHGVPAWVVSEGVEPVRLAPPLLQNT